MLTEIDFHGIGKDTWEATIDAERFWKIVRRGPKFVVLDPDGSECAIQTSKTRAFDACRDLIAGKTPEPPRRMKSRRKYVSPEERAHRSRVKALGCVINDGHCGGALHYHHVKPRKDGRGICLCFNHHDAQAVYGIAFHAGEEVFADRYATEVNLLELVTERLAVVA